MNYSFFLKHIISISFCFMLSSCSNTKENTLPNPEIKVGIAKVSGKITNFSPSGKEDHPKLILIVLQPVNATVIPFYQTTNTVNEDGIFSFEVPMQCSYAVGYIYSEKNYDKGFNVCLTSGKETKMEIIDEKIDRFKITNQTDSLGLTSTDLINMNMVIRMLIHYRTPGITGCKTSNEFVQRAKIRLNNKLKKIAENEALSETAKNYLANSVKMFTLNWELFCYRELMQIAYLNDGNEDLENFNLQEPDKKYYAFLKDFNLNNPQYLYDENYPRLLQRILSNAMLNIPVIGDTPIDQWMKEVKKILSKLVGFKKGLFYDMLAANSYTQQFENELRPLSDKQIENIHHYFKGEKEDIAKILIGKNNEIIPLAVQKDPLVVNETPAVSKEKLMDAIISKYKEKVVVVDFWATWCGPCLAAMAEYRTVKSELKRKDVIFVYLTNRSSPQKLWKEKIKGISGEHYYLKDDEWEYLMESFRFEGIPSYVIFDKKGEARHKFTAYPGNEKMQAMIEELLK